MRFYIRGAWRLEDASTREVRNLEREVTLSRDFNGYVGRSAQDFCLSVKFLRFQLQILGSKQPLMVFLNPHKNPVLTLSEMRNDRMFHR